MSTEYFSNFYEQGKEDLRLRGFRVYEISGTPQPGKAHGRRDFYKIGMVTGDITLDYGERQYGAKGTFLFCANPLVSHTVIHHKEPKGYGCLFTEAFVGSLSQGLRQSPLFRSAAPPLITVHKEQQPYLRDIFRNMMSVHNSDYEHKDELIKSSLALIIHETMRIRPQQIGPPHKTAAERITHLFLELLERQFPIENASYPLRLRSAQDFAEGLSVHINYLNRSVKEVTGKPTSVHIAERIAEEAKALLQHSDWSVAEVAYALGFEYPTYFNNYFKRVTGQTPKSFRPNKV